MYIKLFFNSMANNRTQSTYMPLSAQPYGTKSKKICM